MKRQLRRLFIVMAVRIVGHYGILSPIMEMKLFTNVAVASIVTNGGNFPVSATRKCSLVGRSVSSGL